MEEGGGQRLYHFGDGAGKPALPGAPTRERSVIAHEDHSSSKPTNGYEGSPTSPRARSTVCWLITGLEPTHTRSLGRCAAASSRAAVPAAAACPTTRIWTPQPQLLFGAEPLMHAGVTARCVQLLETVDDVVVTHDDVGI